MDVERATQSIHDLLAEVDEAVAMTEALLPREPAVDEPYTPPVDEQYDLAIGMLVASGKLAGPLHPFWGPVSAAIRERLLFSRCELVTCEIYPRTDASHPQHVSFAELVFDRGFDGFVIASLSPYDPEVAGALGRGIPALFVDDDDRLGDDAGWVITDNRAAMVTVVEHLASQSRTRIAHVAGYLGHVPASQRLEGFETGLRTCGLLATPEYIEGGDWFHETAYAATQRLLALPQPPDAITTAGDIPALGVLAALEDAGVRVPEDIAVTGFDGTDYGARAGLTTMRQDTETIGRLAAEGLLQMIERPEAGPYRALVPAELVVRGSSVA